MHAKGIPLSLIRFGTYRSINMLTSDKKAKEAAVKAYEKGKELAKAGFEKGKKLAKQGIKKAKELARKG